MKSFLKVLALAAICFSSNLVEAKSGGGSRSSGGFSSSSRSSSSYSKPSAPVSKPSSFGWGSSSKSTPSKAAPAPSNTSSNSFSKPSSGYGSQAQTSTRPTSKADVARYQSAAKSGKAFTTRESAVADFKSRNASTYTSKYSVEPTSRPDYIPRSYNYNGQPRDISYNQSYGGYGYWSGGNMGVGQFLLYDALSDAAMTNTLMARQNYYVGQPPRAIGFWGVVGILAGLSLIAWFFISLFRNL